MINGIFFNRSTRETQAYIKDECIATCAEEIASNPDALRLWTLSVLDHVVKHCTITEFIDFTMGTLAK